MGKRKRKRKRKNMSAEIDSMILNETGNASAYHRACGAFALEDVFTTDSVYLAACRCASGFRNRADTSLFMRSPWQNARRLAGDVLSERFVPRYYAARTIMERGKPRRIVPPVFEAKIVQKILDEYILRPLFECRMVSTNYASVRGRGTDKLYRDVLDGIALLGREHPDGVIVICDFSGYFASIDNGRLEQIYHRYISDPRIVRLLRLFAPETHGLSLGNETSQVPASYFPSNIDHYFKDRLGLSCYFRYMDDTLCGLDSWESAASYIKTFKELTQDLGLTLVDEKIKTIPYGCDFVYCKERFIFNRKDGYYYRIMNPAIARNEARKLRAFAVKIPAGAMERDAVLTQYRGVRGMIAGHPNTRETLERLDRLYEMAVGERFAAAQKPNIIAKGSPVLVREGN